MSPNGDKDVDNCQILGFIRAKSYSEAMDLLLENNPWIIKAGFSKSEIMVKQVLTEEQKKIYSLLLTIVGETKRDIMKNGMENVRRNVEKIVRIIYLKY